MDALLDTVDDPETEEEEVTESEEELVSVGDWVTLVVDDTLLDAVALTVALADTV